MAIAIDCPAPSSDHRGFARLGFLAVAAVFGLFCGFAAQAPLDSAAIAPGRVAAESSTKPIQHLEGGIIRQILVKEAEAVKEGQVLFRLESTQARATSQTFGKQLDVLLAQEARLEAEREGTTSISFPGALLARRSTVETAAALADQERQFKERRSTLDNDTKIWRAKREQTMKQISGTTRQETSLQEQISSLSAEIVNVTSLYEKGLYSKSKLMGLQRERARLEGQLAGLQGDSARLNEVLNESSFQLRQVEQRFREEAGQQLTEVRSRLSDVREKLSVADDVMSRVEIRAPQSGIVQGLKVHTPGAVIKPGESLAELVPTGDKLVMVVRVSPLNINSVEAGQKAEVRLPAFSTRRFPTILGKVDRVGADVALDEFTKEPYYPARVVVDQATVPDEVNKKLQPGMAADVLITTGERTLLQYLIGPLSDLLAKSMREQ